MIVLHFEGGLAFVMQMCVRPHKKGSGDTRPLIMAFRNLHCACEIWRIWSLINQSLIGLKEESHVWKKIV